jgi:hypothetical protein
MATLSFMIVLLEQRLRPTLDLQARHLLDDVDDNVLL